MDTRTSSKALTDANSVLTIAIIVLIKTLPTFGLASLDIFVLIALNQGNPFSL